VRLQCSANYWNAAVSDWIQREDEDGKRRQQRPTEWTLFALFRPTHLRPSIVDGAVATTNQTSEKSTETTSAGRGRCNPP
jgi:hypothetical protein